MTTIITRLKPGSADWQMLQDLCLFMYLDGECYAFAIALHQGLGWPLIGVMDGEVIRHAGVRDPDGMLHDARGTVPEEELGHPFGLPQPYDLREITEKDLHGASGPPEARAHRVGSARRVAETLWPDLPWRESLEARMRAFVDALESLSREHGLWIRSPTPANLPVIAVGDDAEGGYKIDPVLASSSFTIDRFY